MKRAKMMTVNPRVWLWLLVCAGIAVLILQLRAPHAGVAAAGQTTVSDDGIWQGNGVMQPEGFANQSPVWRLDSKSLEQVLSRAPLENKASASASTAVMSLPLPGGSFKRFRLAESSLFEPALAAKYPEIKMYLAQGVDDPATTARLTWSPRGFYAFILTEAGGAVSIQPARTGDVTNYVSYSNASLPADAQDLRCLVEEKAQAENMRLFAPTASVGGTLRVYRTAIATTVEYTNQANLGGGSVANTLASLAIWLGGVNATLEKEVAVRLVLVATNTQVIFTAEPDGLTNGNNGLMISEVPGVLSTNIGSANFDIGHAFGTIGGGGAGLAGVGVICSNNVIGGGQAKSRGATLFSGPNGQSGQLGVIAHEFGHQLGALHTFNAIEASGNCVTNNRSASSAFEVASGSTLMSYGGICSTNNLAGKEFRLHAGSFTQITNVLANATCNQANWIATGNNVPTISGVGNFTIPKQTPFALTATGSDADANDVLTYTWDQVDAGGSLYPNPPYGDQVGDPVTTTRPLFRSFPATTNPLRLFPSLTYILNNANVPPATVNGFITGENLPSVARTMNFRATVRDNRANGGGVNEATAVITVDGLSGPFAVTSPNGGNNISGGVATNVTWDVAGSSSAPVNAANVKISLSLDGGNTFPTVLATSTANDGSESLVFPNGLVSTQARIKIEAVGNIFFDISDGNFNLTPGDGCPAVSHLNPNITNVGSQVILTGINFTGVTAVNFTGANVACPSANCTVNSDTQITLTVPASATTGPLTLVKPGCANLQTAVLTICPTAPVTLTYDGGTGASALSSGANTYFVVRATPPSYPATLSHVRIRFDSFQQITQGSAMTVIAAANASGSTTLSGLNFQTSSTTIAALGQFVDYPVTPLTINAGDFVVGFIFPSSAGFPGLHDGSPTANRSYRSTDSGGSFVAAPGDWLIRAVVFTGNCAASNTAPTFTPAAALARQQGSPAGAAVTVGTVSDSQTAAGNLTVTQIAGGTATGITVTNIVNNAGTISAQLAADCNAVSGTVRFQVSDGSLTGTGDLQVNVNANTPPTLSYAAANVVTGGTTTINPATGPADNGTVNSIVVQSTGTYTGTISVNAAGVISLSNAAPLGTHTITIRATDNCGGASGITDASFQLTVAAPPPVTIAKAFNPTTIPLGSTSTVTLTLTNGYPFGVIASFSDTLTNMQAVGGPVGGTCASLSGNNLPANATNLNFSGVILPASGSCQVSFVVRGMAAGVQTNTTSGVTTDQSPFAGAPSNTASLTVVATTITKTFSPATIPFGSTSTVTLTLTNGNAAAVLASFSDTLTNMVAVGGPIGGSCGALAPISFPANATTLNFSGIVVPGNGSCFVSFVVRGTVAGVQPNTTSGVTMNSFGVAGPPSNTASLTVNAPTATIAKAFSPTSIPLGGTSQVRLTLSNASATSVLAAFSDTLVNMQAVGGTLGSTCAALSTITIPANATNVNVSGIVVPANGSCLLTFDVRGTVAGTQSNTTSGVTTDQSPIAGPVSNTATLNVLATTIAKAFSPATIVSGGTSTVTLTLTNTTAAAVLASFTDTLANMTAVGGPVGGTCSSLSGNTLAANATNLNFTGVVVPGNGSCTVTFPVRSTVVGTHPNTTSGVTMNNSGVPGPASNTANLTVTASLAPTLAKKAVKHDFDGDGKSDLSRWRSELGAWEIIQSSTGATQHLQLVEPNDEATYLPVAADFDGDGKYDGGVYRASDGVWLIKQSSHGELVKAQFGLPGDVPMPADFEGDGQADLAVWRNNDGLHVMRSYDQIEQTFYLGQAGDVPVIGDFDGDGLSDVGVFEVNEGRWLLRMTATSELSDVQFGQAGDQSLAPMVGDFDGDGIDDLTVCQPAAGVMLVRRSTDGEMQRWSWGLLQPGERWVIGDYDGDGRAEVARWHVTQAAWQVFFNQSNR